MEAMEEQQSHMTEMILKLTLDIICLLTGERCAVVKMASIEGLLQGLYPPPSRDQNVIAAPPPPSPTPNRSIEQKVLEVINQVIDLLSEEKQNERYEKIVKKERMEEDLMLGRQKDSEGPKEAMMEDRDVSANHLQPRYSWDSTQEGQELPDDDQGEEELFCIKMEAQEGGASAIRDHKSLENFDVWTTTKEYSAQIPPPTDEVIETMCPVGGRVSLAGIRPDPRHSQDTSRKGPEQGDDIISIKAEEAETLVGAGQVATEVVGSTWPIKEVDVIRSIASGHKDGVTGSSESFLEDDIIAQSLRGGSAHFSVTDPAALPIIPGPSLDTPTYIAGHRGAKLSVCQDCGKCFTSRVTYHNHRRVHSKLRPFLCLQCGKRFKQRSHLASHQTSHSKERPFSCPDCGKSFANKAKLNVHRRYHTGENLHNCPQCGKDFAERSRLIRHQRQHLGYKPC